MPVKPLTVDQLYKPAHAESLPASTRRAKAFNDFLGQDRAREAVHMALAMPHDGYNIFAVGSNGLGKRTMIKRLLQEMAVDLPPASDWCYLNNFADPRKPIALQLPPGKGALMQKALVKLWRQLSRAILATFQHEAYQGRVEGLKGEQGNSRVPGIFAAVPYCLDLIGAPYIDTHPEVLATFRPKSARRPAQG